MTDKLLIEALDARYQPDGAIQMALSWLESALNCKQFEWDADQREWAAESLKDAKAEWSALKEAAHRSQQEAAQEPVESDFTDTGRAALLWVLWHHQGGSSPVGQPIRFALGMGADERLGDARIEEAKRWAALAGWSTEKVHKYHPPASTATSENPLPQAASTSCEARKPLTEEQIGKLMDELFHKQGLWQPLTVENSVRVTRAIEAAHGITDAALPASGQKDAT